jgi:hypothetical protein
VISELKKVIDRIVKILSENDEQSYAKCFGRLAESLDINYLDALYQLKSHFGGAGSFNDLILQKNGQMLISENDELDDLKHKLYDLLTAEIENVQKNGTSNF